MHHSLQRQRGETEESSFFFKLHGDIYGTPQQLRKKSQTKRSGKKQRKQVVVALSADHRSQNNSNNKQFMKRGQATLLIYSL